MSKSITFIDGDKVTISKQVYKDLLKAKELRKYVDEYGLEALSYVQEAFMDSDGLFGKTLLEVFGEIDAL